MNDETKPSPTASFENATGLGPVKPVPILVRVGLDPALAERLSQLSRRSGMRQETVAAALLQSTLEFPVIWPEALRSNATGAPDGHAPAPPATTARQVRLAIPVTYRLNEQLYQFSQRSGLTRQEVAVMLLQSAPDQAVEPAITALRILHRERWADLWPPEAAEEAPRQTPAAEPERNKNQ